MWTLQVASECTVHLNYRSAEHVKSGGAESWLRDGGWALNDEMRSTRSSGEPRGPCAYDWAARRSDGQMVRWSDGQMVGCSIGQSMRVKWKEMVIWPAEMRP